MSNIQYHHNRRPRNFLHRKVRDALPEFFTQDYPKLVTFLEKYYDYLDSDGASSFDSKAGRVDLVGFNPTAVEGGEIKISARPANESTIRPLRASVIDIDPIASKANAVLDYQEIQASLSGSTSSTSSTSSGGSSY